jgi:hypothetical protein
MRATRRLLMAALLAGSAATLAGCSRNTEDYAAELGFYQDGRLRWDISGSYPSFEACKEVAYARHEIYTRQDREYSWACLLRDSETGAFTNRYR